MDMLCFGRTDETPKCLVQIPVVDGVVNEEAARRRFKFDPGSLPLIPYREEIKPTPPIGKKVTPMLNWYDDEVVLEWLEEDADPVIPPSRVTPKQLQLWLLRNSNESGNYLEQVNKLINSGPDGLEKDERRIEFDKASYFERTHPLTIQIAFGLGLSDSEIDTAFAEASLL